MSKHLVQLELIRYPKGFVIGCNDKNFFLDNIIPDEDSILFCYKTCTDRSLIRMEWRNGIKKLRRKDLSPNDMKFLSSNTEQHFSKQVRKSKEFYRFSRDVFELKISSFFNKLKKNYENPVQVETQRYVSEFELLDINSEKIATDLSPFIDEVFNHRKVDLEKRKKGEIGILYNHSDFIERVQIPTVWILDSNYNPYTCEYHREVEYLFILDITSLSVNNIKKTMKEKEDATSRLE